MKKEVALTAVAFALVGIINGHAALSQPKPTQTPADATQAPVVNPDFEQSEALSVQLGVRSKVSKGQYEAEFIIHGPNESKLTVKKTAQGNSWVHATFPDDFGAAAQPGDYKWKCMVGGKEAVRGKFKIKSNGSPANELKIER